MMKTAADLPVLDLPSLDPIQCYKAAIMLRRNTPRLQSSQGAHPVLVAVPNQIQVQEWDPDVLLQHIALARLEVVGVVKGALPSQLFADLTLLPVIDTTMIAVPVLDEQGDARELPCAPPQVLLSDLMPASPADLGARMARDIKRITAQVSKAQDATPVQPADPTDTARIAFAHDEISFDEAAARELDDRASLTQPCPGGQQDNAPVASLPRMLELEPMDLVVVDEDTSTLDIEPATPASEAAAPELENTAAPAATDDDAPATQSPETAHECDRCRQKTMGTSGEDAVPTRVSGQARTYRSMLRTGQVCENFDGDLVMIGTQATGSVVRAAGSVHIYGRASGTIRAGQEGDTSARIYVSNFNAQLVDIAGRYQSFEKTPEHLDGKLVEIWLENDELLYQAL